MNGLSPLYVTRTHTEERAKAYDAIDTERDYQERTYPTAPSVGDSLGLIIKFALRCEVPLNNGLHEAVLNNFRKIAGIATRALETYGAPKRID